MQKYAVILADESNSGNQGFIHYLLFFQTAVPQEEIDEYWLYQHFPDKVRDPDDELAEVDLVVEIIPFNDDDIPTV